VLIEYINEYICGVDSKSSADDLEYSAEFIELERLVRRQDTVEYGEHLYAPEPIDWAQVEKLCRTLYENTLDLRVAVILARCLLERYGFSGFIAGLRLISLLLRQRWENVHPQLVAEDRSIR
jgi:type VI secretion system protein ImpA